MKGLEDWGSRRRIDFLSPDTFLRKIIIVSTTCNKDGAETARIDVIALNHFHAIEKIATGRQWNILKKHKTWVQAIKFHEKYVNKLKFKDTKIISKREFCK